MEESKQLKLSYILYFLSHSFRTTGLVSRSFVKFFLRLRGVFCQLGKWLMWPPYMSYTCIWEFRPSPSASPFTQPRCLCHRLACIVLSHMFCHLAQCFSCLLSHSVTHIYLYVCIRQWPHTDVARLNPIINALWYHGTGSYLNIFRNFQWLLL